MRLVGAATASLTLRGAQEVSAKNEFEPPAFQAQAFVAKALQIKEARRRLTTSVCHAPPFCGQCASLVAEPVPHCLCQRMRDPMDFMDLVKLAQVQDNLSFTWQRIHSFHESTGAGGVNF